jgi:uncharacterized protein YjbI with pentapeptide repeats
VLGRLPPEFAFSDLAVDLGILHRQVLALTVALRLRDGSAARLIGGRLRRGLARLTRLEAGLGPPWIAQAAPNLRALAGTARRLLAEVSTELNAEDLRRLHRWITAPHRLGDTGGVDLFEMTARGRDLTSASMIRLHVLGCDMFGAHLARANLGEAVVEDCDVSSSDSRFSCWAGAAAVRSRMQRICLFEADLTSVMVSDSDLRGADLSAHPGGATANNSIWVRCDLRDTVWTHRQLQRAHFVACRLSGARDFVATQGTSVVRCDLGGAPPPPPPPRATPPALPAREAATRWLRRCAVGPGEPSRVC